MEEQKKKNRNTYGRVNEAEEKRKRIESQRKQMLFEKWGRY